MTPARSLAASVVALGFASALTAPQPALAAPASCGRAENFAAQSGAELLEINKLQVRVTGADRKPAEDDRKPESATATGAVNRALSSRDDSIVPDPEDSDTLSESIGLIGTGALGYLGALPTSTPRTPPKAHDGDVTSTATGGLLGPIAERGRTTVNGLAARTGSAGSGGKPGNGPAEHLKSAGAGGGEPGNGPAEHLRSAGAGGGEPVDDGQSDGDDGGPTVPGDDSDDDATAPGGDSDGDAGDDGSANSATDQRSTGTDDERTTTASLAEVGLGEARTAMIAKARIASAAYARMLDGRLGDNVSAAHAAMAEPLLQLAPPTEAKALRRSIPAGKAGPLRLGSGQLNTRARWEPGMECGLTVGETGRADASLTSASLLDIGRGALVRVPGSMTSRGTTALERDDDGTRSVARSTITAGRIELAGGKVRLRVLRAPVLEAAMSAESGGKVDYRPAIVEISGDDITTQRLTAAGEHVDISLTPQYRVMESATLQNLTEQGELGKAEPMPMPTVPDLPPVADAATESAPAAASGLHLRVALGDVRHAVKGQAIAARASAVQISLTQSTGSTKTDKGYGAEATVALDMSLGVLEAAAVSPEADKVTASGAAGGLPITGADVTRVALIGGTLLLVGAAAVMLTRRRRRTHS